MNSIKIIITTASIALLLSGCATRGPIVGNPENCSVKKQIFGDKAAVAQMQKKSALKAYQLRIKPIVGSAQADERIVVDMGVVQRIWIAPYKDKNNLVTAHTIYSWMRKPDFIPGESLPKYYKKHTGMVTVDNKYPYIFRGEELDRVRGDFSNETIKKFVNNVYKEAQDEKVVEQRMLKASKFDEAIKEFIKKQ